MKLLRSLSGLFLITALVPLACAANVPTAPIQGRYTKLWTDSPFTTKPVTEGPTILNPFDDYALSTVAPTPDGGYYVVLLNKKKPDERVTIQPSYPNAQGFKVTEVRRGRTGLLSTTVVLSDGVKSGTVGFDEKLLALKPAPTAKQGQPGQPGQPPNGQPINPGQPVVATNNVPPGVPPINPNPVQIPSQPPGGGNNFGRGNGGNGSSTSGNPNGGGRMPRPRVVPPATR